MFSKKQMQLILAWQFELLVCEQLEASGLDVTFQLQQLLLSVAEEQADGSIIYSDAIVDAGTRLFDIFFVYSLRLSASCCFLAHSLFFLNRFFQYGN